MLRLLGFVFLVIICVSLTPWGLLVGAILCIAWLLATPAPLSKIVGLKPPDRDLGLNGAAKTPLSAIPLLQAVYCANCDLITNSPHDACGICGSHSVVSVSRMWQLNFAVAPVKAGKFRISVIADIRRMPVAGLKESTKLIGRLAELGGDIRCLHIQVDPVFTSNSISDDSKLEVLKPVRGVNVRPQQTCRKAS